MAVHINEIRGGWPVYDRDGTKVGTVYEVEPNYVLVQKGVFSTTSIYIPAAAITSTDDEVVQLEVLEHEIKDHGWDVPPAE